MSGPREDMSGSGLGAFPSVRDVRGLREFRGLRGFRGRWGRSWWSGVVLFVVCVAMYLPGVFTMPPVDRDESRFAQASRQMVEAADDGRWGELLVPRVQERDRLNKPILIYWLQAIPGWVFDRDAAGADPRTGRIWAYRLVSVLCAALAAVFTWRAGRVLMDPRAAWLGGLMLGTCVMVMWDARQARADQLLLACTAGALWALAVLWRRRDSARTLGPALWLWVAVGLGVMAKGPITPMVVVLAMAALGLATGRWDVVLRKSRAWWGVLIVLGMIVPWVLAVGAQVGFGEYARIVWDETIGRSGGAKEGHWGPPGYHLVLLAVLLFPWSLFTLEALVGGFRRGWAKTDGEGKWWRRAWRRLRNGRAGRAEVVLWCWIAPAWVVFELVATKLPHYTLVLYPAIALLTARWVLRKAARGDGRPSVKERTALSFVWRKQRAWWQRFGLERRTFTRKERDTGGVGAVIYLLIGLAILYAIPLAILTADVINSASTGGTIRPIWIPFVLPLILAICVLARSHWSMQRNGAIAYALGALVIFGWLLPGSNGLWASAAANEVIQRFDPKGERPLATVRYHEDSLVFLTRGRVEKIGAREAEIWLVEHPDGLVVWQSRMTDEGWLMREVRQIGWFFNYSKGERVNLLLFGRGVGIESVDAASAGLSMMDDQDGAIGNDDEPVGPAEPPAER